MRSSMTRIVCTCIVLMSVGLFAQERLKSPAPSKQSRAASTQPATTQPAPERLLYAGHAPDEWTSYQAMHEYFLQRFVESQGFGDERMVNLNNPRFRKVYADGTRYMVGHVQLLSLNGGNVPFAYASVMDAGKEQIKHAAHEPVGNAEIDAIAKLKDGMTVVLTGNEGHREMIGAIRATANCTQCHDVPEGTLLGAFKYRLQPEPILETARPIAPSQKR